MADANKKQSKREIFFRRSGSTVLLWLIIGAAIAFQNQWLFFVMIALLGMSSFVEVLRMLPGRENDRRFHVTAIGVALAYFGGTFWHVATASNADFFYIDGIALFVAVFVLFCVALSRRPDGPAALWSVAGPLLALVYIPILFSYVTRLLVIADNGIASGAFYILFLLVVTKFTDMGAYCTGSLIGKHKMIPHISPGKTWEGFAGAMVVALAAGHALLALTGAHMPLLNPVNVTVISLALALTAVLGDLAESVIKRALSADDSGQVLPGIGGSLDLIDSVLFTAPLFYFILHFLS
ncbi:MAG: phosphatidate cytidylyltransferase [Verrucomicrobiales bacterium]|jgi:phosphatidate cytidylyltransferase